MADTGEPTLLVQLSDLHLRAEEGEPGRRLERAVSAAAELLPRPQAVLLSGDLADEPTAEVYERVHRIVGRLGVPIHAIPGNHDDRDLLAARFAGREHPTGAPVHVLGYVGALRLVGCDTTVPGEPGGVLGPEQLGWLARALADQPARPTLLALHHPPLRTGLRAMDAMGLDAGDSERLQELLADHPQVLALACGHVHRTYTAAFAGRPLLGCPSTNSALRLDLRSDEGLPLTFPEQPLGFAVHALLDGRLVSHVQSLEAQGGRS